MMIGTTATPTIPLSNAERQARYRRNSKDKYVETRTKYRHSHSKWDTDAAYLSVPFVAMDGEGYNDALGNHVYNIFAMKGDDDDLYISNDDGLATWDIFDAILEFSQNRERRCIFVIYGGSYDFNMWMKDIPRDTLERIYKGGYVDWGRFRIAWRRGKNFYIAALGENGKPYHGVTIYDTVSFFQTSFVNACDAYLGEDFYERDIVVANKALRGQFAVEDEATTKRYNEIELINLLRLMDELRSRLNKAGLRPSRWDGPGAVAAALLKREHVKKAQADCPEPVARAGRYAYAGGRFEVVKFGSVREKAWEYDVNSAYPAALRNVPDLNIGEWKHYESDPGQHEFALYHVRYRGKRSDIPGALFRRDPNGTVCYPTRVTGWYWGPEIGTLREYARLGYAEFEVIEAWVYDYPEHVKPFHFIDKLYRARQVYKRQGDGAHVGIKLGLNSLYGKLAQQVGASQSPNGTWRYPPFHQLEWAGYVTSYCRARVLSVALQNPESVIAFETDAVFTSEPLDVPISDNLGDFEETEFTRLTYLQSGIYFGESGGAVEKSRGVDKGQIHENDALAAISEPMPKQRFITVNLTRFVGLGVALSQTFSRWLKWESVTKHIMMEPSGKRVHFGCWCESEPRGSGLVLGCWHATLCPMMNDAHSCEFPVEWINPDPAMSELAERRETPSEWD